MLYLLLCMLLDMILVFFFKQKTAYEMRISDWSSDVCSSDLDRLYRQSWSRPSALLRGQFRSCRGAPHLPAVLGACRRQQRHAVIGVARGVDGFAVVFLDVGLGTQRGPHRARLQAADAHGGVGQLGVQHADQRGRGVLGEAVAAPVGAADARSEEHTSELQSLMRIT